MHLVQPSPAPDRAEAARSMTCVVFSGDMDKLIAALSLATSAAAMGVQVTLFFTFWGISALRTRKNYQGKSLLHRALNTLLPARASQLTLSRKNMLGMGPVFFRHLMRKKNVANVHELVEVARAVGVRMLVCSMSMDVMGLSRDELVDGLEFSGAATCVNDLVGSSTSLFI